MSVAHKSFLLRIVSRVASAAIVVFIAYTFCRPLKGFSFSWLDVVFMSLTVALMAGPLYAAFKLYYSEGGASVRWLCGAAACIMLIFSSGTAAKAFGQVVMNSLSELTANRDVLQILQMIIYATPVIAAFGFYALTKSWLMSCFEVADDRLPSQQLLMAKNYFGLFAYLIFTACILPPTPTRSSLDDRWQGLIDFGPLVIAIVIYKIAIFRVKRRINRSSITSAQVASSSSGFRLGIQ